jgi:hypothetical protein
MVVQPAAGGDGRSNAVGGVVGDGLNKSTLAFLG